MSRNTSKLMVADLPSPPPDKTGWPWTEQGLPFSDRELNDSALPRITIVTPSYNQGQFIEETIRSVLLQGYPNLEYIIIDGGSTDGSVEIIRKYEKYLHFWCSESDGGQYEAINKGFDHSTGEIMAWLNSDDMFFPWTFKTVASIWTSCPEIEWLTTLYPCGLDWNGFIIRLSLVLGYSRESFLDGYYCPWLGKFREAIQQESTFWKRNLWNKVGNHIRTEFQFAGDFDLWSRFYEYTDLYATPAPLGNFRIRFDQRVRNNQYGDEAITSLSQARERMQWSPNHLRGLATNFKLNEIPKIRIKMNELFGYTGMKIIRKKPEYPDSYWGIEKYRFL